jgi:hypothetical protein
MSAQTLMAPVMAFGADADERPGGGARGALAKREVGEKRGVAAMGQHPFKRAWRGGEEGEGKGRGGCSATRRGLGRGPEKRGRRQPIGRSPTAVAMGLWHARVRQCETGETGAPTGGPRATVTGGAVETV